MRIVFCFLMMVWGVAAAAQDRRASHCIALVDNTQGIEMIHNASWQTPLTDEFTVRLHYIAHASFPSQTAGGLSVVTDYTGFLGSTDLVPDVVTMNHAHSTHWTDNPDPRIPHVLPGWGAYGVGIDHHLDLGEMLVRNVPTDIRSNYSGVETNGNSNFVFEVAGLCIGHLGHLHHVPTPEQFAALGRLDVVMAAVDGGTTLPLPEMIQVLERLRSSVVIPMHWFSGYALDRFLTEIGETCPIERVNGPSVEISLLDLPSRPKVVVLTPAYLTEAQ